MRVGVQKPGVSLLLANEDWRSKYSKPIPYLRSRQPNRKGRPVRQSRCESNRTTVRFDSPFGNCQSESCSSGVACTPFVNPIEAVEDTLRLIFLDSRPLILNQDSDKTGPIRSAFA